MKKILIFIMIFQLTISFTNASLFTITDKNGNIIHNKDTEQNKNAFLNEKATEYSLQEIYDKKHCIESETVKLDDGKSDALSIAIAVTYSCKTNNIVVSKEEVLVYVLKYRKKLERRSDTLTTRN